MIEKNVLEISEILNDVSITPIILDVREKWEYDICHIENSVHIPMGKITERKDDLNHNDMIIVVCHHGVRSRMVAKYLDANGFTNIINLSGGVDAWSNEVDPSMTKYV